MSEKEYKAESIEDVRSKFDVFELSNRIRKQGDVLKLSEELNIKARTLSLIKEEGRILSYFPDIKKSKASALARLRTDRELELFAQKYNIKDASVRDLIKLVRKWNQDIQKNPFLLIEQKEHDIIVGSLLGDASIRQRDRNSCFRFTHTIKQKKYAKWKSKILDKFIISEFREVKRKILNHPLHQIDFATRTHPVFNYYRNLFYKNSRKGISKEILDQLNPKSLAVWVCDDGSFSRTQGYIILCTNSFSLKEHKLMKEFFNKRFGLDPTIGFRDQKYYYIRFKKDDSQKLIKIIKPYVPQCMLYKIGEIEND